MEYTPEEQALQLRLISEVCSRPGWAEKSQAFDTIFGDGAALRALERESKDLILMMRGYKHIWRGHEAMLVAPEDIRPDDVAWEGMTEREWIKSVPPLPPLDAPTA